MKQLIITIFLAFCGYMFSRLTGIENLSRAEWYGFAVKALLAIGLFASVYGIDTQELNRNKTVVGLAVTIGVLFKIVFIGGILYVMTGNPLSFLLGTVVAQIDPLSVAALINNTVLSQRAKAVLIAWSSFDDPVTVISTIYIASLLATLGLSTGESLIYASSTNPYVSYLYDFAFNLGFAGIAYLLYRILGKYTWVTYLLILAVFAVGIWQFWMLGVALSGLFLRPQMGQVMNRTVTIALYISIFLLGILLIDGLLPGRGLMVAVAAILAQMIVAFLLTFGYAPIDRIHLAFSQQNGVTAIILSLVLEPQFHGVVAAIAPAILFINLTYLVFNALILKVESRFFKNNLVSDSCDTNWA